MSAPRCEDCRHFESGPSCTDVSGVCLERTDWEGKLLEWRHFYDSPCEDFEDVKEERETCEMLPSFTEPGTLDCCQEFRCSKCGEFMVVQQFPGEAGGAPMFCPYCGARNGKAVRR